MSFDPDEGNYYRDPSKAERVRLAYRRQLIEQGRYKPPARRDGCLWVLAALAVAIAMCWR